VVGAPNLVVEEGSWVRVIFRPCSNSLGNVIVMVCPWTVIYGCGAGKVRMASIFVIYVMIDYTF
jgi:hypothetical protein